MSQALRLISYCALALLAAAATPPSAIAADRGPIAAAVAEFDNDDTAGEDALRTAEHAARVEAFAGLLRERLAADGRFEIVEMNCPDSPCSPTALPADALISAARRSGARLLIYGGIHKMSTLVQWGTVQAVDLEKENLVLDRSFSFRGDTDEAFRRAADFVARYVEEVALEP